MKLILIRHGETDWNKLEKCQGITDVPLNENGEMQARYLADSLKNEEISAIYSSHLSRAIDTANEIAKHHEIEVRIDERFGEMDQGKFEGLEFSLIREMYSDVLRHWREDPETLVIPGGESLTQVQDRAWSGFNKLVQDHADENILLVSHNLTIITLLCKFSGKSLSSFREFIVSETSKTVVSCENGRFNIDILNDTSHIV